MTIRRITSGMRAAGVGITSATKWFIAAPASGYKTATPTSSFAGAGPWVATDATDKKLHILNANGRPGASRQWLYSVMAAPGTAYQNPVAKYLPGVGIVLVYEHSFLDDYACVEVLDMRGQRIASTTRTIAVGTLFVAKTAAGINVALSNGAIYVGNTYENGISKLDATTLEEQWSVADLTGGVATFMETDNAGNVYAVGGNYLHKVNSSGTWQWSRQLGSAAAIRQIAVNKSTGDVAVVYNATATTSWNVVLINTSGTSQWVRALGGTTTTSSGVAFDSAGNVYSLSATASGAIIYVAKWDSSGTLQFQRSVTVSGGTVTNMATSRLWCDHRNRLWFHALFNSNALVYCIPTTVATGAYVAAGATSTVADSALSATTPAHTLTTITPTVDTTRRPYFSYDPLPFVGWSDDTTVTMTGTYRATV